MKERRKSPRVRVHDAGLASKIKHMLLAAFGASGPDDWDPVFDLSVGGVCFLTKRELMPEQGIVMTLRIDKDLQPIELEGLVRRVGMRDERGRFRVAVMFSDYKEDARKVLEWFEKQYAGRRKKRKEQRVNVEEVRTQKGLDTPQPAHTPKIESPLLKSAVIEQGDTPPKDPGETEDG